MIGDVTGQARPGRFRRTKLRHGLFREEGQSSARMAGISAERYVEAAKAKREWWIAGLLVGVGFLWMVATSDSTVLQIMLGLVAVFVLGITANVTRKRAHMSRVQESR